MKILNIGNKSGRVVGGVGCGVGWGGLVIGFWVLVLLEKWI